MNSVDSLARHIQVMFRMLHIRQRVSCILLEGYLLLTWNLEPQEASRFHTEVLQIGQGETPDEKREDDRLFEDETISSDEDIVEGTNDASSDDAERREDLIACRDCGVVFAHFLGLEVSRSARVWEEKRHCSPDDLERCRRCFEWVARDLVLCRRLA
ncbi:unnamed protein product [Mytilus edulis]|uniref:Uncharacterized protein n=1 Tax=Mytilus edulis TaxID=6550 RepID=A0A8S3VR55_MYTED|nr:unnamed protein product [Mytilus edulis]